MRELAKRYDSIADYFLRWTPSFQFREIVDKVLLELVRNETSRHGKLNMLDVGCGHGTWIKYILERIEDDSRLKITGIDISQERINLAKSLLSGYSGVNLETTDFLKFDSQESYDVIFIADVLELIDEQYYERILQKCFKLLNIPGYTVIVDKDRYSLQHLKFMLKKRMRLFPKNYLSGGTYEFIRFPSFKYLSQIALRNGFLIVRRAKAKEFHALVLSKSSRAR
jgi:2-polyprenyl-3-methyl-5-hydroxy-6-metoxy-1,4-benzoquinol methylase